MGRVLRTVEASVGSYHVPVPRKHASAGDHVAFPSGGTSVLARDFDLDAIVRDSSRIVDDAASDAHRIVSGAHRRAQRILEKAHGDADEIEKRAREDGAAVGRADALALIEEELGQARATMQELIESARSERRSFIESAEKEIVRLAYAVAERVVHGEIERNPDVVVDVARAAIKRLVDREHVTVRVNPDDLERMRAHREDMLSLGDMKEVRVIGDGRVDRGGVILETDLGSIDARVSAQLQETKRTLDIPESDD